MNEIVMGRWYPNRPPALPGEDADAYTNRLTGADGTGRRPFDHRRRRQCSIGWHDECSDRDNLGAIDKAEGCGCPCHEHRMFADARAGYWNEANPVGTLVTFGDRAVEEPDVVTTSTAWVDGEYAVVELAGFDHPVPLAWLEAVCS